MANEIVNIITNMLWDLSKCFLVLTYCVVSMFLIVMSLLMIPVDAVIKMFKYLYNEISKIINKE